MSLTNASTSHFSWATISFFNHFIISILPLLIMLLIYHLLLEFLLHFPRFFLYAGVLLAPPHNMYIINKNK